MRNTKYVDIGLVLTKDAPGIHYINTTKYQNIIDVINFVISMSVSEKCEMFCAWSGLKYERILVINTLKMMGYEYRQCTKNNLRKNTFRGKFTQGNVFYIQVCTGYRKYVTIQAVDPVIGQKKPAGGYEELKEYWNLYHYTRDMYLKGLKKSETRILYGSSTISRGMFNRKFKGYSSSIRRFDKTRNLKIDDFIRPCLHTGYNNISEEAYKYESEGVVLDINSLYSDILLHTKTPGLELISEGDGIPDKKYTEFDTSYYQFWRVCVSATLKKDGIPCLVGDKENDFICPDYLTSLDKRYITLSESDRKLLYENYDITYFKIDHYMIFNAVYGQPYMDYILPIYDKKRKSKGIERDYSKLMINGLIGSFGKNIYKTKYIIDEQDGSYIIKPLYLTAEEYTKEKQKTDGLCYITASVTSGARYKIISYIKKYRDRWLYTDTDSIHLKGKEIPEGVPVSDIMGDFKVEHTFEKCIYKGLKNYILVEDGKLAPVIAGIPKDSMTEPVYPKGVDRKYISKALDHKDLSKLYQKPIGIRQIVEDLESMTVSYETTTGWLQKPETDSKAKERKDKEEEEERRKRDYWRQKDIERKLRGNVSQCVKTYNRLYKGKRKGFEESLKILKGMYYQGYIQNQ